MSDNYETRKSVRTSVNNIAMLSMCGTILLFVIVTFLGNDAMQQIQHQGALGMILGLLLGTLFGALYVGVGVPIKREEEQKDGQRS